MLKSCPSNDADVETFEEKLTFLLDLYSRLGDGETNPVVDVEVHQAPLPQQSQQPQQSSKSQQKQAAPTLKVPVTKAAPSAAAVAT